MKFSFFSILFFVGFIPITQCQTSIQVQVVGINPNRGEIFAALYASETGFPADASKAFKTAKVVPSEGKANLNFTQVPEGKYAIALFHDMNGDGKLNTNFLGIPKEGYGVSNNVRNLFSAPGFNESSFHLGKSAIRLTIKIQY
jgi:uncharacterized protein (DUF2141 family)